MTTIVNLTPHAISIYENRDDSNPTEVAASGEIARCAVERIRIESELSFPVSTPEFGEVINLPKPIPNTIYIVSGMVLSALSKSRDDVFAPGELIRDESGRVVGCLGLSK